MPEAVALVKKKQGKFAKKVTNLKKKVTKGEVTVKDDVVPMKKLKTKITKDKGIIYIGHLPHGFYEPELKAYFSQFGAVTRARVNRSARNGNSKGYGFVEFKEPEVAKVAAESMDNYLMFKRRIVTSYIPPEKQHSGYFKGKAWKENKTPAMVTRKRTITQKNKNLDGEGHLSAAKRKVKSVSRTIKKLAALGIEHTIQPIDAPNFESTKPLVEQEKPVKSKKSTKVQKSENDAPLLRKRKAVETISNGSPKKSDNLLVNKKKAVKKVAKVEQSGDSPVPVLQKKKGAKIDSVKKIVKAVNSVKVVKTKKSDSAPLLKKKDSINGAPKKSKKPLKVVDKAEATFKVKAIDSPVTPVKARKAKKLATEKKPLVEVEKKSLKTIEKKKTKLLEKKKAVKSTMSEKVKLAAKSILDSSLVKQTKILKKDRAAKRK